MLLLDSLTCVFPCPISSVFQEQYKCVYDTLEEYTVCGTSFFYVHQLSEKLKQKSLKERTISSKKQQNEYEREYCVSIYLDIKTLLSLTLPKVLNGTP